MPDNGELMVCCDLCNQGCITDAAIPSDLGEGNYVCKICQVAHT